MQEYNLDIQHIPGNVNPADHLCRESLDQAFRHKDMVRAETDKFFQSLRIDKGASDGKIQQIISDIIYKNRFCPIPDLSPRSVRDQSVESSIQDKSKTETMHNNVQIVSI